MTITEKFLDFHKDLLEKHDEMRYNSLLKKKPFVEVEDDTSFSSIHGLIDEDYLNFISLDIGDKGTTRYTVNLTDKAIEEIDKIKQAYLNW